MSMPTSFFSSLTLLSEYALSPEFGLYFTLEQPLLLQSCPKHLITCYLYILSSSLLLCSLLLNIIAFQYSVGSCHTSWISHNYILSLFNFLPFSTYPYLPLQLSLFHEKLTSYHVKSCACNLCNSYLVLFSSNMYAVKKGFCLPTM